MRKKIAAANWKMNLNMSDALQLTHDVMKGFNAVARNCEIILAPSFPYLSHIAGLTKENNSVHVAAQDCSAHSHGAYTGEVSAQQLKSAGATHVILGHSERRTYHHEQNEILYEKIIQALSHNIKIIFCCGETLQQRNSEKHFATVTQQLEETVFKLDPKELSQVIIAYEPVWAIGTGINATAAQAQEMHQCIRKETRIKFGNEADHVPILYGGSCNEKNAAELFAQPDIDGGLIGGASLKTESFLAIADALG